MHLSLVRPGVGMVEDTEPVRQLSGEGSDPYRREEADRRRQYWLHIPSGSETLGQDTRMRILVDARPLLPIGHGLGPTGVGRWTQGVIRGLSAQAPDWEIVLTCVTRDPVTIDTASLGSNVSIRVVRFPERWFLRAMVLGVTSVIDRPRERSDVLLGPRFITWPGPYAQVPVIHDLAFLSHPESVQRRNLAFLRMMVPRVVRRAAAIITVSNAVRSEIAEHFKIEPERILVVPNGCDFRSTEPAAEGPRKHLLFVGTFEPRKNLYRVLEAYRSLRAQRPDTPELVIVGGPGWRSSTELQHDAMTTTGVRVVGYVDDASLFALYREALMLVFPSLYEGFGLPVIEAMATGTPVITSRRGGLAEVAGDAALYVDPLEPTDIARGIGQLLDDPGLASKLVARGREQASRFTWESSGRALKDALETVAGLR